MALIIRLFWIFCDQGIFSLSNFLLSILFARWLSPSDYGLFAVSFSGFLLLSVFHWTIVLEPLLIQSAGVPDAARGSFLRSAVQAHAGMMALIGLLSTLISAALLAHGDVDAAWCLLGGGVGGELLLSLVSARRLCLVFLSARTSALVGLGYFVAVLLTTLVLAACHAVTWFALWAVTGGWSLAGTVLICGFMFRRDLGTSKSYSISNVLHFQWRYTRWGTVAAVCSWIRFSGLMLILSRFAGLEAIAGAQAIVSLTNPLAQINIALNATWLVDFSNRARRRIPVTWVTLYCLGVAVLVLVGILVAPPLVHLMFHGIYDQYAWLLPVLIGNYGLSGLEGLFTSRAKALGMLLTGYFPQVFACAVGVAIGFFLIPQTSVSGAIFSIAASSFIGCSLAVAMTVVNLSKTTTITGMERHERHI